MIKIFRADDRRFEENPGRVDGFRLMSDAAIAAFRQNGADNGNTAGGRLGAESLNFDIRRLNPGEFSSLYHFHRHAEELFMIVSGAATLRTSDGMQTLAAGDIAFFETGGDGAHQLYNHTDVPCTYLDVRTFVGCDVAEYPDSGRLLVVPTMERFDKAASAGYFDGEPSAAQLREIFTKQ